MFDQKISDFHDLPLEDKDRKKTDLFCTIVGSFFAITMFVLAFVLMNTDNYNKSNFPTDSDNIPCAYGVNKNYPFVYFPSINDISLRVCLSNCPRAGDPDLSCRVNSKVQSCDVPNIYSASVSFGRLGGFCAPTDEAAQQKLKITANLTRKWDFLDIFDTIRLSLLISLGLGLIWLVLVQLVPRAMASIVTVLSILTLGAGGLVVLLDTSNGFTTVEKLAVGITLLIIAVLFAFFLCFYRKRNRLTAVFLDWATKLTRERLSYFLYIFLFIIFTIGLIILCLFQHLAYLSHSDPRPQNGDVFLKLTPNIALLVLNIVQFIWGLQFLKDSFNFILSGLATQWYCEKDTSCGLTFSRLLKFHFGTVVGGSFMNAFFNIIDFFLEALRCYPDGACPACTPCCNTLFNCFANVFDLVRTDVYAYTNLSGIAYCNSARNCEYLIENSRLFVGSQSLLYFYRISAYCFTVGVAVLSAYFIQKSKLEEGNTNFISMVIVVVLSYCVLNYFIDLHANVAEGIQISYLIEQSLNQGKQSGVVGSDPFSFKYEIGTMEKSYLDGKFC